MVDSSSAVVLGISADYHDSAAALVIDDRIIAANAEERFSRTKHDSSLPVHAVRACLDQAGIAPGELTMVAFYSKPLSVYERVLVSHARFGPAGARGLVAAVGTWTRSKLWIRYRIERLLQELGHRRVPIVFAEHHMSHAASAFYPSPFDEAAILTVDGVGEWATASIGVGTGSRIELSEQVDFPDSLGLFYSTMTAHCGFAVNDGEYKLMGLAPYGEPIYAEALLDEAIRIGPNGEFAMDQRYFAYQGGTRMARR